MSSVCHTLCDLHVTHIIARLTRDKLKRTI